MLATVIGIGLFNSIQEPAQANQPAFIASVINLEEGQELQIGEQVELSLTLQNTSQNESINDINVSLLSTENVITWNQVSSKTKLSSGQTYQVNEENQTTIPFLGAGEKQITK
ncbi:MAG: hypothetical protein HC932_01415 [Thermales bacterium]|nr:hypothetical protein [Thermales bacterium]